MTTIISREAFAQAEPDSRLNWFNPPQSWRTIDGSLIIEPDARTDFWQKTHYGFEADNGHFLYAEVEGDFILTTKVHFEPVHQYDQAGLMIRLSSRCWLKTSVEYEPDGPPRLGAVVTNSGYSDWSTQNFSAGKNELRLRVRREANDYIVEYAEVGDAAASPWTQIRLARLLEDDGQRPVQAGLYACSPAGAGYVAGFDFLEIETGRIE